MSKSGWRVYVAGETVEVDKVELGVWLPPTEIEVLDAWERYLPFVEPRFRLSCRFVHKATPDYRYTIIKFAYAKKLLKGKTK